MRKVGIMSMQRIANYGSFLQAYALKQLIEKVGCNVEFSRNFTKKKKIIN